MRLLAEHNNNVNKRYIKPKYSTKEDNNYKQYIKVALITNEEAIISFNNEGIYINHISFTQDFASFINEEVIHYLIDNKDYVMEGYNDTGNYVIMNNHKLVGKNCLAFIHNTEHGTVRQFLPTTNFSNLSRVHLIGGKIGSHIANWLYNQ